MKTFPQNPCLFLLHYALINKWLFIAICFCGILSTICEKLIPYIFSKLINIFNDNASYEIIKSDILNLSILLILSTILAKILFTISKILVETYLQPRIFKQISLDCFTYLNGHSVEYFSDNMAGALAQKGNNLTSNSEFYRIILSYLADVLQLVIIFTMLLNVNISFAITFLTLFLISAITLAKLCKITASLRTQMVENRAKLSGTIIDTFQNAFFVRIFNAFKYEIKKAETLLQQNATITTKSVNFEFLQSQGQKVYFQLIYLILILYGLFLWKSKKINTADFVLIFMLLHNVADIISWLLFRSIIFSGIYNEIKANLVPFTTPHSITDIPNAKPLTITQGKIEINNITFAYKRNKNIFEKFNLTIEAHQKIGIVGISGGGKSTLISLIQRFYDIQDGQILIDGQNIKEVTQESLHQSISYIPQNTILFDRSIADNIAYGCYNANIQDIIKASKLAYADEFITKLSSKYQTIINKQNQLSGGQMQRISIARAILKNAPLLILDEATSSLDSESEFYIQKAINNIIQNQTVLVIAHRLSTLKNMDRIIVIENGKIIEDGSPKKLITNHGAFYQYWKLQQLNGDNDDQK